MMDRIRQELENGGAVVLPTETVYGLFAKALDEKQLIMYTRLNVVPETRHSISNIASFRGYLALFKESANLSSKTCRDLFTRSLDHYP